jgi:hypothetical protein
MMIGATKDRSGAKAKPFCQPCQPMLRSPQVSDPGGDTAKSYQQLEKASGGVSSRYC